MEFQSRQVENITKRKKKKNSSESKNGSLFTYLPATVTVNGLENEMSSELRFQGRKWGGRKQGTPSRPEGSRGVTPA